jgi:hypothetical protein
MTDVSFCANYLLLDGPLFDGILKTVTTTVAKEILTCEKQSPSALRYLATGNAFEDLRFLRVASQSTGIAVLETR